MHAYRLLELLLLLQAYLLSCLSSSFLVVHCHSLSGHLPATCYSKRSGSIWHRKSTLPSFSPRYHILRCFAINSSCCTLASVLYLLATNPLSRLQGKSSCSKLSNLVRLMAWSQDRLKDRAAAPPMDLVTLVGDGTQA